MTLQRSDFSFDLPEHLVAHHPLASRSESKLLVSREDSILDSTVDSLGKHLPPGSLIIRNNSRVIPSRILGNTIHGGKIEIMLLEPMVNTSRCLWKAIGKPMKKLKKGTSVFFNEIEAKIVDVYAETTPFFSVEFPLSWEDFYNFVENDGFIPLPPYIKRQDPVRAALSEDTGRYQTVYAGPRGSVAAPTAGLHFTPKLIEDLETNHSIQMADVTLHVGAGTFLPVKDETLANHVMHSERYFIPSQTWEKICKAKNEGRDIYAVGTTSLRSLESFCKLTDLKNTDQYTDKWHTTDLFIYPTERNHIYKAQLLSGLMTNFHQPESTLLMLISALIGYDKVLGIYQHAIANQYRFYSYGDSSLLIF